MIPTFSSIRGHTAPVIFKPLRLERRCPIWTKVPP